MTEYVDNGEDDKELMEILLAIATIIETSKAHADEDTQRKNQESDTMFHNILEENSAAHTEKPTTDIFYDAPIIIADLKSPVPP